MTPVESPRPSTVADFLPPEKATVLIDLLQSVRNQAAAREVEVRDAGGGLIGRFIPAPESTPEDTLDPVFLEEIRRRLANPPQPEPVEELLAYLDSIDPPSVNPN
jgi:hypothetical protein